MGSEQEVIKYRSYGVQKVDFIRQALAGYAGGSSIVSEMLQNADDAGASQASFHFRSKDFLSWNNSVFTEQDWENITSIANGTKRNETGKIGTWGTGFLSVFHLTDTPEVHSVGDKIILNPLEDQLPIKRSDIHEGSAFRMPWRRESTKISTSLEADVWNDENIQHLKEDVAVSIYRLMIFLRHIKAIEVFEGDQGKGKLLYKIVRDRVSVYDGNGYRFESWDFQYQRTGVQSRTDTWLYYRGKVPNHLMVEDINPKDTEISIAFPLENRDWLTKNLPGTLYNFLPTPIITDYNFQINGAFFPDNNRRTILLDVYTQREKSRWNWNVIQAIGDLVVKILPDLRNRVKETRRFYEILPDQSSSEEFLKPIYTSFLEAAPNQEIVFSSLGIWSKPGDVSIGKPGSRLPELVSEYISIVPSGVPQTFRDFLTYKVKAPQLDWEDVISFLKPYLLPGVLLDDAHPMINSREKLNKLYSELPQNPSDEQRNLIAGTPLCLDESGILWKFSDQIWRASEQTRNLLSDSDLHFVSKDIQKNYSRLLENLIVEFKGAQLVKWLCGLELPEEIIPISKMPGVFKNPEHLSKLLGYLYEDIQNINSELLKKLPVIYTESGYLCTAESAVYFHKDKVERAELVNLGLQFIHPDWDAKKKLREVYICAGVEELAPKHVICALSENPIDPTGQDHECLVQRLLKLYAFFFNYRSQLDDISKNRLKELPICLTQQGRLISACGGETIPHLPGDSNLERSKTLESLDKLQLDNLVHGDVLTPDGRNFLEKVVQLRPLSSIDLIRDVMLPNYLDERLEDTDRQNLLEYISEQLRSLDESDQDALCIELSKVNLLLCDNGEYAQPNKVYFANPTIEAVFGSQYLKIHPSYGVPIPETDDEDQAPFRRSTWYWLFKRLGVNEVPSAEDLVKTIEIQITNDPPEEAKIESVRCMYDFLNREISTIKKYINSSEIKRLSEFRWLPARNRSDRWYYPREIYQASLGVFIGDQAPLLLFGESSKELRTVLEMPSYPEPEIIARHLLTLAIRNKPLEDLRIYEDLGKRWYDLDDELREQLKCEAIIWSESGHRYWKPEQVFLAKYSNLFGHRRCYLQPPGGNAQKFLEYVGVNGDSPDLEGQSLALLNEIAEDYLERESLDADDFELILTNFDALGVLPLGDYILRQLKKLRIIPGKDCSLYEPSKIALVDQKDLLQWFDENSFPQLDQDELTEPAYRFLRSLGVPLLSELTQRNLIDVQDQKVDTRLTDQINILKDAFIRIAQEIFEEKPEAFKRAVDSIEKLVNITIYSCDKLIVDYSLNNRDSWDISGHRSQNEKALFVEKDHRLYVCREKGKPDNTEIAKEIAYLLFPNKKQSVVIEKLLELKLCDINDYLDKHGYRRLMKDQNNDGENKIGEEIWDIDERPLILDEEEVDGEKPVESESCEDTTISKEPEQEEDLLQSTEEADLSELGIISETDDDIPTFTGQMRPRVPILPNDYGELSQKYGLQHKERSIVEEEIADSDSVRADLDWQQRELENSDSDKPNQRVKVVRFTLTFKNRYEGFLPLHKHAKQMFSDYPHRLICDTDFENWQFELYLDYSLEIIYNQEMLPQFLEAYNIPAGGIIYLERVHQNRCRLFWNNVNNQIDNVHCVELLEDGTLKEYEIPAIEFPCELSEYVLRAEKRLEDPDALFKQAMDKRGVFHTICDVFGEPGKELSYDEIFHSVMQIRQVAQSTIRYQLEKRPCFVYLGNDLWRFEPKRGSEPERKQDSKESDFDTKTAKIFTNSDEVLDLTKGKSSEQIGEPLEVSPFDRLLDEIREEWEQLGNWLATDTISETEYFESFAENINNFLNRWRNNLNSLLQKDMRKDETLDNIWQRLAEQPTNTKIYNLLEEHLWQLVAEEKLDQYISQLYKLVAFTQKENLSIFYRLLADIADRSFERECFTVSQQLYELLQNENAGDFDVKLEKISQYKIVQSRLQELEKEENINNRLILLQLDWEENTGFPSLRRAIQNEVKAVISQTSDIIQSVNKTEQINEVYKRYIEVADLIYPLKDGWISDPIISAQVCEMARKIFMLLVIDTNNSDNKDTFYQALNVANNLPLDFQNRIPAPHYVQVLIDVANDYEYREEIPEAVAIIEYGLYLIHNSNRSLEKYLGYQVDEYLGRLFEQLELLTLADNYYQRAVKQATKDQSQRLSHRRYSLKERRNNSPDSVEKLETNEWLAILESLYLKEDFISLVNEKLFKEFVSDKKDQNKELYT